MHQRTVSNKDSWNASDGLAGWGMAIFMISSVGCGFANSFWTLLVCRIIMGAGEASIINLTGKLHQSIHE
jgi:MFS family permease